MKKTITYLLIFAITLVFSVPTYAQKSLSTTEQTKFTSQPTQNNLQSVFAESQKNRADFLLGSPSDYTQIIAQNQTKLDDQTTPTANKNWFKRNWWVIPVLAGLGVGIYYLAKVKGNSGIRCNDGYISRAQNRQGACSSHGGIAPGF
jgi:hypothetical protein